MELFAYIALALTFTTVCALGLARVLRREEHAPPANVRSLVPGHSDALADAPTAGNVRLTFRAHVLFQNECSVVLLAWKDLVEAPLTSEQRIAQLCELYSRAIFESSFARHFDGVDPRSDMIVLAQIRDAFGAATARNVHDMVATRGVVLRRLADDFARGAAGAVAVLAALFFGGCAVASEAPAMHSVGWLLLQPYGPACDSGQRANDNPTSELFEHPVTARCTFDCNAVGGEDTCVAVGGECDALQLCRRDF